MKQFLSHQKTAAQQPAFIQQKLMVNAPNDVYEQEADAVADRVMRMPLVSSKVQGTQGMLASSVQRKCAHCEEEKKKPIMRKAESGGGFETSPVFTSQLSNTRGGGQAMPRETKSFMESRFGQDFSHVRLHTDGVAADMSAGIQAKAFTHGLDIYFNQGEYSPNTEGGKRLLAHELVHTVQQNDGLRRMIQRELTDDDIDLSDEYELEEGSEEEEEEDSSMDADVVQMKTKINRSRPRRAGACPQGRQTNIVRDDCSNSQPTNTNNYITRLDVDIASQTVTETWTNNTNRSYLCSPNPRVTPIGRDRVGIKCSINHTNRHRDGMAWFTGFQSQGKRLGFHNSQRVALGVHSHGCVRVSCTNAQRINENSWSGRTIINVT
jgi:Domain of unknown function (DUF4157)